MIVLSRALSPHGVAALHPACAVAPCRSSVAPPRPPRNASAACRSPYLDTLSRPNFAVLAPAPAAEHLLERPFAHSAT
jgi:hypothetical protein